MKKTIYIHIGYPKTGTTTLQKHFFPKIKEIQYIGKYDNDKELFDFDITIINDLIFKQKDEIDFQKSLDALKNLFQKNKILLSEESFLSNSLRTSYIDGNDIIPKPYDIAENIRELFNKKEFDVKILFTIRRQDEMITSQYAQSYVHYYSKYKDTNTFKKFLDLYLNKKNSSHRYYTTLDYYSTINEYKAVFDEKNIKVLVFEEFQKSPVSFYKKLCNFLEIDLNEYNETAIKKNENKRSTNQKHKQTRSVTLLDKLSMFKNKYLPFVKLKLSNNVKKKLQNIILTDNKKISKTIFLTKDEQENILNRYRESNKKLSSDLDLDLKGYGYYYD